MGDNEDIELSIKSLIQVHLCAIDAILSTMDEMELEMDDSKYRSAQISLTDLLERLEKGQVLPEYAEVEFYKIRLW